MNLHVSRRTLAREVSASTGLTYRESYRAVSAMTDLLADHLIALDRVTLHRLGVFAFKRRAAIRVRDFQSGEPMLTRAHRQVTFRPTDRVRVGVMRA